jgi:hypothetical protein
MKRPAPLTFLWHHHKPTLLLIVLALAVAVFFALRFVIHAHDWQDIRASNPPVEPWMTPRYIAKSWDVNPDKLAQFLDIQKTEKRPSIADIAKAQGRSVDALIAELTVFLTLQQKSQP